MPASSLYLQEARNNFDALRPAPICNDTNQLMGQCHNVHVSTNCYYGYHDLKRPDKNHVDDDCEMLEMDHPIADHTSSQPASRKRSADSRDYPQSKRLREAELLASMYDSETATKLGSEASCTKLEAQCDEVRLYFRGYGAIDYQLQPLFTTPNSQQSRHISLSHGPYDLISDEISTMT